MLVIQCSQVFSKRRGQDRRLVRSGSPRGPRRRAAAVRTNHWVLSRGSTTSSLRWQRPMTISWACAPSRSPRASRSATIRGAGLVAVEAVVRRARVGDAGLVVEDRRHREAVATAGLVVVVVVGGRDLHGARCRTPGRRPRRRSPARHARRTGCGRAGRRAPRSAGSSGWTATAVSPRIVSGRVVATVIVAAGSGSPGRRRRSGDSGPATDVPVSGVGIDLEVADARPAARAPVDQRLGPVREAVPVQPLERDADRLRARPRPS